MCVCACARVDVRLCLCLFVRLSCADSWSPAIKKEITYRLRWGHKEVAFDFVC